MVRKRTIEARVERLWAITRFPRKFPKRGTAYCFRWFPEPHYILTHTERLLRHLVATENLKPAEAILRHGWLWADAHEFAHGWDVELNRNKLAWGVLFSDALATDGYLATRSKFNALTGFDKQEIFADAIAYTIVNDRAFIKKHPAKYAFARALLKGNGVI